MEKKLFKMDHSNDPLKKKRSFFLSKKDDVHVQVGKCDAVNNPHVVYSTKLSPSIFCFLYFMQYCFNREKISNSF